MVPRLILIVLALAVIGCSRSNRVPRETAAPFVAADPRLAAFIGEWRYENSSVVAFSIASNADGSATVSHPYAGGHASHVWDSVVNNVRLEQNTLRYDVYYYYKGDEEFHIGEDSVGDHPFSGKRNEVTLEVGEKPDTLTFKAPKEARLPQYEHDRTLWRDGNGD